MKNGISFLIIFPLSKIIFIGKTSPRRVLSFDSISAELLQLKILWEYVGFP